MCRSCGSNFTTQATLAWSLPVHPARLGAHLQAHADAKSTVMQLLLCHRKGCGLGVHISKLPRELIDIIIKHYMKPLRTQRIKEWETEFACFEGKCSVKDHFSKSQWFGYLSEAWEEGRYPAITDENQDEYAQQVAEDSGEAWDLHQERSDMWEDRLCQRNPVYTRGHTFVGASEDHPGAFAVYDEILRRDFGLGVFLSHQRLPRWLQNVLEIPADAEDQSVQNTTLAFLTLPSQLLYDDGSGLGCESDSMDSWNLSSCMSSAVDMRVLRKGGRKKPFARVLQALDLKPFVHPVQLLPYKEQFSRGANELKMSKALGKELGKRGDAAERAVIESNVKKVEKAKWPQLLHLVSTSHRFAG
ncbi:hypothetical protein EJ08DRAFT_654293 [Tothia fuscella]|uniref:Uncharacterized protein n=1 Tax=Tothia fuscella TaxID=1048955 RepID=A0A9P4NFA5_9PEZI|nr:hypothetical protein EJ08DRAFT_654293 [Tothia fuscella]